MSKPKILPVEPLIQCEAGRAKTMQRQSLYSPRTPKWPPSDKGEFGLVRYFEKNRDCAERPEVRESRTVQLEPARALNPWRWSKGSQLSERECTSCGGAILVSLQECQTSGTERLVRSLAGTSSYGENSKWPWSRVLINGIRFNIIYKS